MPLVPGKAQHNKFELRQLHRTGISEAEVQLKTLNLKPRPSCAGWAKNKAKFVFVGAGGPFCLGLGLMVQGCFRGRGLGFRVFGFRV